MRATRAAIDKRHTDRNSHSADMKNSRNGASPLHSFGPLWFIDTLIEKWLPSNH